MHFGDIVMSLCVFYFFMYNKRVLNLLTISNKCKYSSAYLIIYNIFWKKKEKEMIKLVVPMVIVNTKIKNNYIIK